MLKLYLFCLCFEVFHIVQSRFHRMYCFITYTYLYDMRRCDNTLNIQHSQSTAFRTAFCFARFLLFFHKIFVWRLTSHRRCLLLLFMMLHIQMPFYLSLTEILTILMMNVHTLSAPQKSHGKQMKHHSNQIKRFIV